MPCLVCLPRFLSCCYVLRQVWDVHSLECLQTLAGHTGPVRTLVYSGGHMFSGSYDKTVSARPEQAPLRVTSAVEGCVG
jgi:WD40 repeat protein